MQFLKVITAFKQIINIAQGDAIDNEEVVQKKALGRLGEAFNFWKKVRLASPLIYSSYTGVVAGSGSEIT